MIYLDNAATTPILSEVRDCFLSNVDSFANPSSMHSFGFECRQSLETERAKIAKLLNTSPAEIIFTSGGTESNNLAIRGQKSEVRNRKTTPFSPPSDLCFPTSDLCLLTSAAEHPSVLEPIKTLPHQFVNTLPNGTVDLDHLEILLKNNEVALVSLMHVNNETGAVNPINEIYNLIKSKSNALLHVDNIQGYGKLENINADLISFCSHKIGGFKGIGGLYIKSGTKINPIMFGGGQEKGLRSGTESLPHIAAFAMASQIAFANSKSNMSKVIKLNNIMEHHLETIENTHFNSNENSSPYIINVRFDGVMGETLLHTLEQHQIYISTGSACSSHNSKPSAALASMGLSNAQIKESIRISFSPENTPEEAQTAAEMIKSEVANLRKIKK